MFPFPKNLELQKSILRSWIDSSLWLLEEEDNYEKSLEEYKTAIMLSNNLPGGSYTEELNKLEKLWVKLSQVENDYINNTR